MPPKSAYRRDPYLPTSIDQLTVYRPVPANLQVYAVRRAGTDVLEGHIFLLADSGEIVAAVTGLRLQRLKPDSALNLDRLFYAVQWLPAGNRKSAQLDPSAGAGNWLIFTDGAGLGESLAAKIGERGAVCVRVSAGDVYQRLAADRFQLNPARLDDFDRLFEDLAADKYVAWRGIVYPGDGDTADVAAGAHVGCVGALHLVQALAQLAWPEAPRLWLVTSGSQAVDADQSINVAQSPLWGLGSVIAHEHPNLRCTRVDLSAAHLPVEIDSLMQDLLSDAPADQVALRNAVRYVPHLAHATLEQRVEGPPRALTNVASLADFQVKIAQPGILDRLELHSISRTEPQPGQVEIEVGATGLNFMNVMSAMGIYPGYPNGVGPLGIECAGIITAVGTGVAQLRAGDRVLAIAFDSLGTHAQTDARLAQPIADTLSFEQAASLPIAFVTAYYALHHMARLGRGERVLIHAATGGVGLAAIQVARWLGAEIYATAGSQEKRAYLQALGIQHVMDSRSLSFADEVLALTDGQGVDVVLNSLSGEAIAKGLSVLAPYGRFIEIGKRDIYQNSQIGLRPFQKNLAYFAIDLDRMIRERPTQVGDVLREVMQLLAAGSFTPLPVRVFPVAQVADAFRLMAQAKHMGKLVIDVKDVKGAEVRSAQPDRLVCADGTYLITGGLGGLGLEVAKWLVQSGAQHLVLMGRRERAALPPRAIETVDALERSGAQVIIAQADVTREDRAERGSAANRSDVAAAARHRACRGHFG